MTTPDVRLAAADLLDKVPDVLRERGWCQCHYEDPDGRVCLEGAMTLALNRQTGEEWEPGLWPTTPHWHTAQKAVRVETGAVGVAYYNDRVAQSVEDALLVAKKAAHSLREAAS